MPRTFHQDFIKDDGTPVTVEYSFSAGSETTYSPMYGADGGDGCEVSIVNSWPNTPEYSEAYERRARRGGRLDPFRDSDEDAELNADIERDEERAQLTDAERERMEIWLIEHHVDEPDDDIAF